MNVDGIKIDGMTTKVVWKKYIEMLWGDREKWMSIKLQKKKYEKKNK